VVINKSDVSNVQLGAEHGLMRQRDQMDAFDYPFFSITDIGLLSISITVETNASKAFNILIVFALVRFTQPRTKGSNGIRYALFRRPIKASTAIQSSMKD